MLTFSLSKKIERKETVLLSLFAQNKKMTPGPSKPSSNDDYDNFMFPFFLLNQQSALLLLLLSLANLKQLLPIEELRRRDRRIPRCALLAPGASPFLKLYLSRNDQSLITFTGLDYPAFTYLINKLEPLYLR